MEGLRHGCGDIKKRDEGGLQSQSLEFSDGSLAPCLHTLLEVTSLDSVGWCLVRAGQKGQAPDLQGLQPSAGRE